MNNPQSSDELAEAKRIASESKAFPGMCGAPISDEAVCGISNCQTHHPHGKRMQVTTRY